MSRRSTGVVAGVLTAGAVAAAVTIFNLPRAESTDGTAAEKQLETAEVTKKTLVDSESHDGTLGHGDTSTISARGSGTVTALAALDTTVTRGKPLLRLDDEPVILLYGTLPAYRTLKPGVEGADVLQFEKNLWALGYRGFTVDDEYTSATADAVEQWQEDLGRDETGTVGADQIEYAPGAVRVDSHDVERGAVVQPGTAVLKTTGTTMVATVSLDVDSQRLARKGATVDVTLPDGSETTGKITGVETVVEPGQGDQEDTTMIEVTVSFAKVPKGIDEAAVTVGFTSSQRENVLTVPVAALLALAEGGYGVEIAENGGTRLVAVKTGLFADGQVEVSGGGLRPGTKVVVPS
ncbi:peptidoglycan-binding protein [Paractinoplanes deccanensis]|uniref:Peptidoglycan-binding protein n=1 Tax=Paractinoplanes deccanensis TaxID=113561 RepID=A0ABQ3Y0Q7_9ACTN|nr:peptidoglycan-binding protein [Actinoplanes deccanensis]GID73591.1 peptidoglycan-binding protein [Actinoplanes deccanensis]